MVIWFNTMNNDKHIFKISISDGLCEYTYPIRLGYDTAIYDIYKKLCKCYKVDIEPLSGKLRTDEKTTRKQQVRKNKG